MLTGERQLIAIGFHRYNVFVYRMLSQKQIKNAPCGANLRQRFHGPCTASPFHPNAFNYLHGF